MVIAPKEMAKQVLDELLDEDVVEVLDFIGYLHWRREGVDQSWFWTEEWQARYQEAKADLEAGRCRDFDDVEDLLAKLKSQPEASGRKSAVPIASRKTIRSCHQTFSGEWMGG